ncbi:MAG: BTAD domain-containing putative transcriptional regulator [Chloroflexota bacterium]
MTSLIKLHFLGIPRIELDDHPIHLDRQKSVALLVYLSVTNRSHSRDWLTALLWPDVGTGRTQLRIALSALRKTLGSDRFHTNRDEIALFGARLWSDIDEFRRLSAALLREDSAPDKTDFDSLLALSTYDFMAGFTLRDAPEFDAWQRSEEQQLRWTFEQVLARCAAYWSKSGNFDAAISAARRWVAIDPLNEESRRLLMKLYAWTYHRPLAAQEYQQVKALLRAELGVEPEAKTTSLFQDIQAEREIQFADLPRQWVSPQFPVLGKLFGRDDAIHTLTGMFNAGARLVSIIGPGGVGKTHLALDLAGRIKGHYEDGCYFLRLESPVSPEFLVSALIDTLGQYTYGPGQAQDGLIAYLRTRSLLIVIDNFHHVVDGQQLIHALVQMALGVHWLITSYDSLNLSQEHRYTLRGLEAPDQPLASPALPASPALQLFVESARRVVPSFQLTAENEPHMTRICKLVLGMPLAIILAASWCDALSVAEIAAEIETNYDFLRVNHHDLPERQRSLRSVFDTMWLRLTPAEQTALMRLSVFRGSFNRAAAKGVANVDLPLLKGLVVKSLVSHQPQEQRYSLHDIYRQYAREKLELQPDPHAIGAIHCHYFTEFVITYAEQIKGQLQHSAWREIDAEMNNIRAAWTYALDTRDYDHLNRLIEPLRLYLQTRDLWEQGVLLFEQARQSVADADSPASRLMRAKVLSRLYHDTRKAPDLLAEALQIALELCDAAEIAHIEEEFGWYYLGSDRRALAQEHFSIALTAHRQQGEHYGTALILRGLAYCALGLCDRAAALGCMNESLKLRHSIGDVAGEHDTLLLRGEIALLAGDLEAAQTDLDTVYRYVAANFSEQIAMQQTIAFGWLLAFTGESAQALRFVDAVRKINLTMFPEPIRCNIEAIRLLVHLVQGSAQTEDDLQRLEATLSDVLFWNLNPDLRFFAYIASLLANAVFGRRARSIQIVQHLEAQRCFTDSDTLAWIVPAALLLAASCGESVSDALMTFYRSSSVAALPWLQTWAHFQQQITFLGDHLTTAPTTLSIAAELQHLIDQLQNPPH